MNGVTTRHARGVLGTIRGLLRGVHMTFPAWWPYPTLTRRRKPSGWCSPAKRAAVYARDEHRCVSCGSDQNLTIDHIQPRAKGGTSAIDNLQTMCRDCNQGKADDERT